MFLVVTSWTLPTCSSLGTLNAVLRASICHMPDSFLSADLGTTISLVIFYKVESFSLWLSHSHVFIYFWQLPNSYFCLVAMVPGIRLYTLKARMSPLILGLPAWGTTTGSCWLAEEMVPLGLPLPSLSWRSVNARYHGTPSALFMDCVACFLFFFPPSPIPDHASLFPLTL